MKIALRTQQIIAEETIVANVIDPLGGSYYVENLTDKMERGIFAVLDEIDERGGTLRLIEEGWFQRHIADFAYEVALKKQSGEKAVIGVNKFVEDDEEANLETHAYDPAVVERQLARLKRVRAERDEAEVQALLGKLQSTARDESANLLQVTIALVKAGATMGAVGRRGRRRGPRRGAAPAGAARRGPLARRR